MITCAAMVMMKRPWETAAATPATSVMDLEQRYLFQNYARLPLVLQRGKGCYVYDTSASATWT